MKRFKPNRGADRRSFTRSASKTHRFNTASTIKRGGYRL